MAIIEKTVTVDVDVDVDVDLEDFDIDDVLEYIEEMGYVISNDPYPAIKPVEFTHEELQMLKQMLIEHDTPGTIYRNIYEKLLEL